MSIPDVHILLFFVDIKPGTELCLNVSMYQVYQVNQLKLFFFVAKNEYKCILLSI